MNILVGQIMEKEQVDKSQTTYPGHGGVLFASPISDSTSISSANDEG